jgi:autoinducer 2 (AI-2) kinase
MAKRVGLRDDIFVDVLETGEVLGYVTQEAAKQSGLSTLTQVVMGGGDVQLGSAGLGVVREGDVAVLGGSFWQQVVNIKSELAPPKDMGIRVNPHVIEGLSQAEGISFFSGIVMRWFRDAFCQLEKLEAQQRGCDVYEILEEKAQKVPAGSYDILPIFSDSMKYGAWYHAAPSFLNLGLDSQRYNTISMFRSLEENAAIVSSINLEKIEAFSGIKADTIVFAGGASKGSLWSQIVADVTGCVVKIPKVTEATALGGAMAAGVGAGLFESLEDAAEKVVVWSKSYTPNLENKKLYEDLKRRWQSAYEVQLKLVDANITTSMWKAPGL